MEYGQMWHVCEEALASEPKGNWQQWLTNYAKELCQKYRTQQEQIQHWYNVCKVQFPFYVDYWAKHLDVKQRTPLLQEQVFDVPYLLPSGRTVRLRGKWDSVDLIGKGKTAGIYLQENKTKGDIKEEQLKRQLASGFDLQTMLYLVALEEWRKHCATGPRLHETMDKVESCSLLGVCYNVVRRPLSGGKGSISQRKPTKSSPNGETAEEFYNRLEGIIAADPDYFFMRWKVEVSSQDIERFKRECLDPVLEQLCQWWEWVSRPLCKGGTDQFDEEDGIHFRFPYGVYNVLAEGGSGETDEYLDTGSMLGLVRVDRLFEELDDA
jgi:hypothetical protein